MTQPSKTMKLTKDEVDRLIQSYQSNQDEQAQLTLVEDDPGKLDLDFWLDPELRHVTVQTRTWRRRLMRMLCRI